MFSFPMCFQLSDVFSRLGPPHHPQAAAERRQVEEELQESTMAGKWVGGRGRGGGRGFVLVEEKEQSFFLEAGSDACVLKPSRR